MNKWVMIVILLVVLVGGFYVARKLTKQVMAPAPTTDQTTVQPTSAVTTTAKQQASVTLTQDGFSPATLTVKAGTTVVWTNKSSETATVNSDPHPTHTDYPPLNLGAFADGQTLSLTFDKPGTYGYHNHLNPSQRATIIVQ